jgi:hypothetical protein
VFKDLGVVFKFKFLGIVFEFKFPGVVLKFKISLRVCVCDQTRSKVVQVLNHRLGGDIITRSQPLKVTLTKIE